MDILKVLQSKIEELGSDEVAKVLNCPKHIVTQFKNGSKTPGYLACQKIIDLWGSESKTFHVEQLPVTEKPLWEGRDVCICLPWYKETYPKTVVCLMALWDKKTMRCEMRDDDAMITRSRNQLAKRFLDSGCTWSIWFDDDMIFPFGNAGLYMTFTNMRNLPEKFLGMHTINRLISHGKTIVGGCYWDRRGGGKLIAGGGGPIMHSIPSDALHPVGFVGTGCLAIHRQVFLDIAVKYPETFSPTSLGNECGFFTNIQTPQRMLGEDESFAVRANEAGHPSFLDLGLICGHLGTNVHAIPLGGSKI